MVIVREQSMREMVAKLREFEGWRCLWRFPVAVLAYVSPGLLFVGATVGAGFIARGRFDLVTAIIVALVAGAAALAARHLARLRLYRKIVADRLWTFEKPNPSAEVPVLVRSRDIYAVKAALRRARFNPQDVGVSLGAPPADALALDYRIGVQEPAAWPQSRSDTDRVERIAAVLDAAGMESRVAGVDVRNSAH